MIFLGFWREAVFKLSRPDTSLLPEILVSINSALPRSGVSSQNKYHEKKNFAKNINKTLYLSTHALNMTYWETN